MEWSHYNFFLKTEEAFLLYNSLSNSFVELEENIYNYLIDKMNSQETDISDIELKNSLIDMKVIVFNNKDEFNELKYDINLKRFSFKNLNLTICPTLHCNFACPYCFEKNRRSAYITEEIENLILEYIKKQEHIEFLNITWYGGEPLLAFDNIVSLTNKFKKLNLKYFAGIITNGYLLTEKRIRQLSDLSIDSMQITVDGLSETHNSRRFLTSGKGTFQNIVNNILLLKKVYPQIRLSIRVNIDKNNQSEFVDVYNFFQDMKLGNTFIRPAFVDDISGCNTNNCLFDRNRKTQFIIEMLEKYNLDFSHFYPSDTRYECGIRNPNSLIIGPRGEIYKCWNDVGDNKQIIGSLDNKIKANNALHLRYLTGADPLEDKKCLACFHFPTCGGGCPYLRIKNEYEGCHFDTCDLIKDNMEKFLKLHYQTKIKLNNI